MSPAFQPGKYRSATTLSRQAAFTIMVHTMGLSEEDCASFWQLARREQSDPGCLERALREHTGTWCTASAYDSG